MTRLSSDSDTPTTTDYDSVTSGNHTNEINTHVLEGLLRDLQRNIALGAIRPDSDQFSSSTEQSELPETDQEEIQELIAGRQVGQSYRFYDNSRGDSCNSTANNTNESSPKPFEESVYEFALSSARRLTTSAASHDADYDLRPKFAILRHKTDSSDCRSEQVINPRAYPKTPDWFFNIPDTRSPFPNFESNLADD